MPRDSQTRTEATSFPEKRPERRQSMPHSKNSTMEHRHDKRTYRFDAPDWMKSSTIDWGGEDDDTKYEEISDSDQSDFACTLRQSNNSDLTGSMTSVVRRFSALLAP